MYAVLGSTLLALALACAGTSQPPEGETVSSQAPPATEKKSAEPASTQQLLILYESQTEADAVKWLETYSALIEPYNFFNYAWEKRRAHKEEGLYAYFGSDCPKKVDSSTIKGFKPGFHIVIGGDCTHDEPKEVLAKFKPHFEGAYLHSGQLPGDGCACPALLTASELLEIQADETAEAEAMLAEREASEERQAIEYFHRAIPDDAADRFHIIGKRVS